ncbi:tRNA lysidine(34) synthetase TilS [Thalassotalea sediminis]|uniref:tRNA lysidine(34) synthetase TilS n=1 Tax=Thalassotalea sediminis TaxID=1759089 RepID=UPI0025727767|nr:tRNA lysidine(34) synthetase TilS [Thalassotalea sediminis]
MNNLFAHFQQQLLPFMERPICLAYSGGVDSQVLLHLFSRLMSVSPHVNVFACHVNHGLSQYADHWQTFTQEQCHKFNIQYQTQSVHLVKQPRQSVEALARDARYHVLDQITPENAVIVTGHHINDQMETFLLALKRGSGIQGLAAMKADSSFGTGKKRLVRPLLMISRQEIEQYALAHDLEWIEDESNRDHVYDRNFIRHQISPVFTQRWPGIAKNIARTAAHCQEAQSLIDEIAAQDLHLCTTESTDDSPCLRVSALLSLSIVRRKHVIRYFLQQHQVNMPTEQQLFQLLSGLSADSESKLQVKVGNKWLRHYQGVLHLTDRLDDVTDWHYRFAVTALRHAPICIELPDNLGQLQLTLINEPSTCEQIFSVSSQAEQIIINFTPPAEKVLPDYRHKHRALKKIWQELQVAPWLRKRIPFIYVDNEFAVATKHFICQPFLRDKGQLNIKVDWLAQRESG